VDGCVFCGAARVARHSRLFPRPSIVARALYLRCCATLVTAFAHGRQGAAPCAVATRWLGVPPRPGVRTGAVASARQAPIKTCISRVTAVQQLGTVASRDASRGVWDVALPRVPAVPAVPLAADEQRAHRVCHKICSPAARPHPSRCPQACPGDRRTGLLRPCASSRPPRAGDEYPALPWRTVDGPSVHRHSIARWTMGGRRLVAAFNPLKCWAASAVGPRFDVCVWLPRVLPTRQCLLAVVRVQAIV
jgi:hypothetical protein